MLTMTMSADTPPGYGLSSGSVFSTPSRSSPGSGTYANSHHGSGSASTPVNGSGAGIVGRRRSSLYPPPRAPIYDAPPVPLLPRFPSTPIIVPRPSPTSTIPSVHHLPSPNSTVQQSHSPFSAAQQGIPPIPAIQHSSSPLHAVQPSALPVPALQQSPSPNPITTGRRPPRLIIDNDDSSRTSPGTPPPPYTPLAARRPGRHVPIVITPQLVASVLNHHTVLPVRYDSIVNSPARIDSVINSPDNLSPVNFSPTSNSPCASLPHKRSFPSPRTPPPPPPPLIRTERARYIPIEIPSFAQRYNPFPPSPASSRSSISSRSSGTWTIRPPLQPLLTPPAQAPPSPPLWEAPPVPFSEPTPLAPSVAMSPSAAHVAHQPSTSESIPSTDPATGNPSFSSVYREDMSSSSSSLNQEPEAAPAVTSTTSPAASAPSSATNAAPTTNGRTAHTAPGTTNLSGLVCNVHRCTGREPPALVGATSTVLGDKLYVFGGKTLSRRRPMLTADLYELDLIRRHWTRLEVRGTAPLPRYFHSMCALGDTKLICYGGMSPAPASTESPGSPSSQSTSEVIVMSDITIYDTVTQTWTPIQTSDNPQGRYAHCATVLPSSAVFASAQAPTSAMHHNPSSATAQHSGSIAISLDGTGGAEMVVVGGQDSANHYIEQVSVFNLRSLRWTSTTNLGRSCGAYRSVVAPVPGLTASKIGHPAAGGQLDVAEARRSQHATPGAASMLVYSNYNFLDVKLELHVRRPDGSLVEKTMNGPFSPPGLRFPNGGVLDDHFVVSGTYLTSSKQEYALWALDLRTLTWSRIEVGGSVFTSGSWNRGVLWPRRNTFVILGNRKRNLVEDYNHRRINFSNVCFVELEAFGLYDNPRHRQPNSSFVSASSATLPPSLRPKTSAWTGGGRPAFTAAKDLGVTALSLRELSDMELVALGGDRIPVNSHLLARRWGPYFVQLLKEGAASSEPGRGTSAAATPGAVNGESTSSDQGSTLRPGAAHGSITSRASSITITPSVNTVTSANASVSTLHATPSAAAGNAVGGANNSTLPDSSATPFHPPTIASLQPAARARSLYLPHTPLTIQAMVHFLYTGSLPPTGHALSSPQVLCSLLQLARPYSIDGLLEAVVERLHQVLDGRNAAAVFNASAMAAGGGHGTGSGTLGGIDLLSGLEAEAAALANARGASQSGPADSSRADAAMESSGDEATSGRTNGVNGLPNGHSRQASQARSLLSGDDETGGAMSSGTDVGAVSSADEGTDAGEYVHVSSDSASTAANAAAASGASPRQRAHHATRSSTAISQHHHRLPSRPSFSRTGSSAVGVNATTADEDEEIWTAERSPVVGLQKRGLRGLMEGRRLRERDRGRPPVAAAHVPAVVAAGGAGAGDD